MAQRIPTRRRPQGLIFYTTALVLSLFAVYSILRPSLFHQSRLGNNIQARGLVKKDLECRLVHGARDKCAFVVANCPDEEAGLISYLQLYYCRLPHVKPIAFTILVVWISLLFSTIGIAASDFLCINLSTIATILGMSESLTGVTFLAFGNGSPDVFSTFAAMSSHSGSLAVGELMGAAGFITAVVAGSMALVKPFKVAKKSFIRDVGFFTVAASFSLVFLADGKLRLWECITMVGFYIFYVVFVVFWHWWLKRSRRIKLSENAARLHVHIPEHQELEATNIEFDEEAQPTSESTALLGGRQPSGETIPTIRTPGTPAWKLEVVDEDDDTRNRYLAELSNNMRVGRPGRTSRRNTITPIRPSLIGALEFRAVLNSLEKKSTSARPINLRRYSDDALASITQSTASASHPELVSDVAQQRHNDQESFVSPGRSRALSESHTANFDTDRNLIGLSNGTPDTAIYNPQPLSDIASAVSPPSPQLMLSPGSIGSGASSPASMHAATRNGLLAPPTTYFNRLENRDDSDTASGISSGAVSPNTNVPTLQIPTPGQKSSREYRYHDVPRSRASSIHLPPPSMSLDSDYHLELPEETEIQEMRVFRFWPYQYLPAPQVILSTLFPTLYGWSSRSYLDRMLGLVTAPSVFLLTITLPIVEQKENDEDSDVHDLLLSPEIQRIDHVNPNIGATTSLHPHEGISRQGSNLDKNATVEVAPSSPKDWNRWLVILQLFTAPIFVAAIIWANLDEETGVILLVKLILGAMVFSLVGLFVLLATTSADREPKYRPLFCYLGFLVAIAWISTIANEVVGVLKAFGVIFDISDAILGLTIFAVGNSLGDLVADITVARLGYPVMALSACFGGPMLNILLGIGIGGMYMTIHNATHKHIKHPDKAVHYKPYELEVSTTLIVSGITLLVTLIGLLIVVPLNGWRMDRKIGLGLIALWTISTIANVVLELTGVESSWIQTK